jgi:predicted esterase
LRAISTAARKETLWGKPIYIAAGETDQNLGAAKRAVDYYEGSGAKVTFEEFKGRGHSFDPSTSEILYDWLIANGKTEISEPEGSSEKDPSTAKTSGTQDG